mmetsp:Transcript_16887/g.27401  ORF Transcript_16887/g.27401 Transcript_16887/m.27401 type:complete len:418 (+) Transcript_16887:117-1370(+)
MADPTPPPVTEEEAAAIAAADEATKDKETSSSPRFKKTPSHEWKYTNHENDGKTKYGLSRDMLGYGIVPVQPHWPRSAKVALNFVINYEEGGEMCTLHGDSRSECLLSDIGPGLKSLEGQRSLNAESIYDYGARSGFWRLYRLFKSRNLPVTVFAVGMALERNIEAVGAMKEAGNWEIASHGYRWWDYQDVDEDEEREHIKRTIEIHQNLLGKRPYGFYQGKPSINTRKLVVEDGGFLYDSDAYNDDLPYWTMEYSPGRPHLVIPYTLTENDMLFTQPHGFASPDDFTNHLKKTLDYLILEGRNGQPKMMSVGLHCRLARPARAAAIAEFVDYAKSYGREVWICTREEIANHWYENHLPRGVGNPIDPAVFGLRGGTINKGNKFSFLGNLSAPREESSTPSSSPMNAIAESTDGDVI